MCICDPFISNIGAILSNSFVKTPRIEAEEAPFDVLGVYADEYLRYLTWLCRGLQAVRFRQEAEHRKILRAIIASTLNFVALQVGVGGNRP